MTTLEIFKALLTKYESVPTGLPDEELYRWLSARYMNFGVCALNACVFRHPDIETPSEVDRYIKKYRTPGSEYWCRSPAAADLGGLPIYITAIAPRIEILKKIIKEIEDGTTV